MTCAHRTRPMGSVVTVRYEVNGTDWKLSVSDNGVGRPQNKPASAKPGLGTSLIKALARRLEAQVEIESSSVGMNVSIVHATFTSRSDLPVQGQIPELLQGWPQ